MRFDAAIKIGPWVVKRLAWIPVVVSVGLSLVVLPPFSFADFIDLDIKADWVVTKAAFEGQDAYRDPAELAAMFGVEYKYNLPPELEHAEISHPRTPGAFLVMSPLLVIEPKSLSDFAFWTNLALFVLTLLLTLRALELSSIWLAVVFPLAYLGTPAVIGFAWATQSFLIAILLVVTWLVSRKRDSTVAGVVLGLATVLKVYPGLLILALLMRRRRAGIAAIVSVATLTGAGLLLPGVNLGPAILAIRHAAAIWLPLGFNASLAAGLYRSGLPVDTAIAAAWVAAGLLMVLWFFLAQRNRVSFDAFFFGTLAVATLTTPISWLHYVVPLYPAGLWLARNSALRPIVVVQLAGWAFLALGSWWLIPVPAVVGEWGLFSTLLLIGGVVGVGRR